MEIRNRGTRFYEALQEAGNRFWFPAIAATGAVAYLDYITHHSNPQFIRAISFLLTGTLAGAFLGDTAQHYRDSAPGGIQFDVDTGCEDFSVSRRGNLWQGAIFGCALGVMGAMIPVMQKATENLQILSSFEIPSRPQSLVNTSKKSKTQEMLSQLPVFRP